MAHLVSVLFVIVNSVTLVNSVRQGDWLWATLAGACLLVTMSNFF